MSGDPASQPSEYSGGYDDLAYCTPATTWARFNAIAAAISASAAKRNCRAPTAQETEVMVMSRTITDEGLNALLEGATLTRASLSIVHQNAPDGSNNQLTARRRENDRRLPGHGAAMEAA